MPQMAPLNWVTLFLYFILIFFSFNCINYFIFLYPPQKILHKKSNVKMNWKW